MPKMPDKERDPKSGLTDGEAESMLAQLKEHYREPVMPVSRYCAALDAWGRAIIERSQGDDDEPRARRFADIAEVWAQARLAISKSNLLWRLIYLGEPLRTRRCPEHDGHWSGYSWPGNECPHGCNSGYDVTGWIAERPEDQQGPSPHLLVTAKAPGE